MEISLKPQDFLEGVADLPDYSEVSKGVRKIKRKAKSSMPKTHKSCDSCIYCQESGSVYTCRHPRVNDNVEPNYCCSRYIAANY